jgi:hypothetical protein
MVDQKGWTFAVGRSAGRWERQTREATGQWNIEINNEGMKASRKGIAVR